MSVEEKAPAKINLGLRIAGKRGDGYHNICSIFQTVDLCDGLRLSSSPESMMTCTPPGFLSDSENLSTEGIEKLIKKLDKFKK